MALVKMKLRRGESAEDLGGGGYLCAEVFDWDTSGNPGKRNMRPVLAGFGRDFESLEHGIGSGRKALEQSGGRHLDYQGMREELKAGKLDGYLAFAGQACQKARDFGNARERPSADEFGCDVEVRGLTPADTGERLQVAQQGFKVRNNIRRKTEPGEQSNG